MGLRNRAKFENIIQLFKKGKNGCYLSPSAIAASKICNKINEISENKCELITGANLTKKVNSTHSSRIIEL